MAIGLKKVAALHPVPGVRIGTARAGIRYPGRRDMALMELAAGTVCAGVFTRNAFCAAPVQLARKHLEQAASRYWLVNAGNANAGTGAKGLQDARRSCRAVARLAGCDEQAVLPFSTGVIGEHLPMNALLAGVEQCYGVLASDGWLAAAEAIMTTDTMPKGYSCRVELNGVPVTLTGIAKGSGMIRPDMATMLAFIATDAAVSAPVLQHILHQAVGKSFNRVTVDGDTSTNDACMLAATGQADMPVIDDVASESAQALQAAVDQVCLFLAQAIVRDGEGASKFITVDVRGGVNDIECENVAYTIAHSPLVKTAFFAADPNWGRILAAIGRAGVPGLSVEQVSVFLDEVCIVRAGQRAEDYNESAARHVMANDEITLRVDLGRGDARVVLWTCDLSYDYVRINAEYRS